MNHTKEKEKDGIIPENHSLHHAILKEQLKSLDPPLQVWVKNILDGIYKYYFVLFFIFDKNEDIEYIKQMKVLEQQWNGAECIKVCFFMP